MTSEYPVVPIRRPLTGEWTLRALGGPVPAEIRAETIKATVPGSVHTDLLAAGLIPDPYLDDNEALLSWIGVTDWRYATTFSWSSVDADQIELVFEGLDTIASIELNGHQVGHARNMHRTYRFDVQPLLTQGLNELSVTFASPIKHADTASLELGYRPHVNHHPYNAIRKMASSFGWDWGIDTSSSGIWRPVYLESWSRARLSQVRPVPTVAGDDGLLDVHVELSRVSQETMLVRAMVGAVHAEFEIPAGETVGMVSLRVPEVARWWPRGYGDQPLYGLEVSLIADDDTVDLVNKRIAFRTVSFDTTPDAAGTPFTIVINGQPVFVRGANWIPDDAFPHRVDRARYERRIEQAEFANINLIRVWGGGIYESDDFYDLCDERGMLAWQDFLLACAAYAEEEPLRSEIEAEAREAVTRLGSHPSLVVLNGNNENLWGYEEWNWKLRLEGKSWGAGYYYDLFPAIVADLAPHVGYTPGSPFSPDRTRHPNDPENGTMHIWDLWNQRDYPAYREYTPRFVAEFGWQGPPTWPTLTASISDAPLTPESPGMLVHQKAMEGNAKLTDGLIPHLPLPNNIVDWHWAMSLNQATAISTAIEHFRSLQPHCMGAIVWQLNDCWPVTSWAAIDGYGRPKPLLYALRHAYADRIVTIQPRDGGLAAIVVNDSPVAWAGDVLIRRLTLNGTVLAEHTATVDVPTRATSAVPIPSTVSTPSNPANELLQAGLSEVRGNWFFAEYRDSALGPAGLVTSVERSERGYTVRVTARTLARDVTLLVDKLDVEATVDNALVTLLPGETVEFAVTTKNDFEAGEFARPEVLRSANQLLTAARLYTESDEIRKLQQTGNSD